MGPTGHTETRYETTTTRCVPTQKRAVLDQKLFPWLVSANKYTTLTKVGARLEKRKVTNVLRLLTVIMTSFYVILNVLRWVTQGRYTCNCYVSQRLRLLKTQERIQLKYCFSSSRFSARNTFYRLRWSRGSVLAFSTQVRGFKPGRSRRIFRAKKSSARLPSEGK